MTTKRGGARQNAGRASDGATGLQAVLVKLTPGQREKAAAAGRGNASAGIRAALDALPEISTIVENGRIETDRTREMEAAAMIRAPRQPVPSRHPTATRPQVRRWMRANALDYDGPTQLAEAANCVFDLPAGAMDDPEHWVWDEAADSFPDD